MSDKKSIDQAVKGISEDQIIESIDLLNFSKAAYISRKDNFEYLKDGVQPQEGSNDAAFKRIAAQIKKEFDKPVIVGAADATHYNYVNGNQSFYMIEWIKQNAATWVEKVKGQKVGKPVQIDHSGSHEDTLGRVMVATPFIYSGVDATNLNRPDGHIELIYYVTEPDAIERVVDSRYKMLSVSAGTTRDQVTCNICGRSVSDWNCEHVRGKSYKVEDEKTGREKEMTAYWVWAKKRYKEVSFVVDNADKYAVQKRIQKINMPGIDAEDNLDYNNSVDESVKRHFCFMVGNMDSDSNISQLYDHTGNLIRKELILSQDSIMADSVHFNINDEGQAPSTDLNSRDTEQNNSTNTDPKTGQDTPATVNNNTTTEEVNTSDNAEEQDTDTLYSEETSKQQDAVVGLLIDFLETDNITIDDACDFLYARDMYVAKKYRTDKAILLDHLKSKLSDDYAVRTRNKDSLPDSIFAGPLRSVPIFDKQHLDVANELIQDSFAGSDVIKDRIATGLDRKSRVFLNDESQEDKPKQEDNIVAELKFKDEAELLASTVVQKALDEQKTSFEQKIDKLQADYTDNESKLKTIAVSTIIDLACKLQKPIVASMKDQEGDNLVTARDEIQKKLETRSFDSLIDTLNDYQAEAAAVGDQQDSTNGDDSQSNLESNLNGQDSQGRGGSNASEEGNADGQNGQDAGNGDEINQGDASNQQANERKIKLSSFIKKT